MFRNMIMLISGFILFMALLNCAHAVDQEYIVSFVVGQTRLGLVFVTETDTAIEAAQASIIPIGKNLGSTAVLVQTSWWDDGLWYDVLVVSGGYSAKPLEIGLIEVDYQLKKTANLRILSQNPGQYYPLHLFQTDWSDSGCCRTGSLLTAGRFGTSGANNYVSYLVDGKAKTIIFVNPDDRSPGTAAVAPDGGMVSQMTFKGLNHIGLVGKLIDKKLTGSLFQWLNVNDFHGYSQSLSNPIESINRSTSQKSGLRYLVYRNFQQPGSSNSQSRVMIQNVDSKSGKPKGSPRAITKFATAMNVDAEKFQSIAISSNGGLILYTAWSSQCNKQILYARRLVNGYGVGNPESVVGCGQLKSFPLGVYGINITEAWAAR